MQLIPTIIVADLWRLIVRIGITNVLENAIKAVQRVYITCVSAEDNTRLDLLGVWNHLIRRCVELE